MLCRPLEVAGCLLFGTKKFRGRGRLLDMIGTVSSFHVERESASEFFHKELAGIITRKSFGAHCPCDLRYVPYLSISSPPLSVV